MRIHLLLLLACVSSPWGKNLPRLGSRRRAVPIVEFLGSGADIRGSWPAGGGDESMKTGGMDYGEVAWCVWSGVNFW